MSNGKTILTKYIPVNLEAYPSEIKVNCRAFYEKSREMGLPIMNQFTPFIFNYNFLIQIFSKSLCVSTHGDEEVFYYNDPHTSLSMYSETIMHRFIDMACNLSYKEKENAKSLKLKYYNCHTDFQLSDAKHDRIICIDDEKRVILSLLKIDKRKTACYLYSIDNDYSFNRGNFNFNFGYPKNRSSLEEKDFVFCSHAAACDGYGQQGQYIFQALRLHSINAACKSIDVLEFEKEKLSDSFYFFNDGNYYSDTYIQHTPPTTDNYVDLYINKNNIVFTMCETNIIPNIWVKRMEKTKAIIVPSEFCLQAFRSSGVLTPIYVYDVGVDPNMWPERDYEKKEDHPFTFFSFANTSWNNERKNFSRTYAAFKRVFGNSKDVRLLFKTTSKDRTDFPKEDANFKVMSGKLHSSDIKDIMSSQVDCLVFPSSGEGYGQPPREAMSMGIPCIITDGTSLVDLCNKDMSYVIHGTGYTAPISSFYKHLVGNDGTDLGGFYDFKQKDLEAIMEYVFKHQEESVEKGKQAAKYIRQHSDSNVNIHRLIEIVNDVKSGKYAHVGKHRC